MVMALATWSVIVGPSLMAFLYSSEQIFSVKPIKGEKAKVIWQHCILHCMRVSVSNLLDLDYSNYLSLSVYCKLRDCHTLGISLNVIHGDQKHDEQCG